MHRLSRDAPYPPPCGRAVPLKPLTVAKGIPDSPRASKWILGHSGAFRGLFIGLLLLEVHYRGEDFPLFFLDCSPKGLNVVVPAA